MTQRKTIEVAKVLEFANYLLRSTNFGAEYGTEHRSKENWIGQREGVIDLLESILLETGNYNGFTYNEPYVKGNKKIETNRTYTMKGS